MAAPKQIDLDSFTIAELEHGSRIVETDAPKYQNPNNAAQTWSGKGKQPDWVTQALAQGRTLESLLTDDIRPVPRSVAADAKGKRRE